VDEGVARARIIRPAREAAALGQRVAELAQHRAGVVARVGPLDPVVELNLDLPPAALAVLGQAIDERFVVLLGRIEVGVPQWPAIGVAPGIHRSGILHAPALEPPLLLVGTRRDARSVGDDGRLEVVSDRDHEVGPRPPRMRLQPLPGVDGQPAEAPRGLGERLGETTHRTYSARPSC
jgi:hypothetical protein